MIEPLYGLSLVIVLGVAAQWIAWRLRLPSILLLLLGGMLIGPLATLVTSSGRPLLDPDSLFGEVLLPFVSLSVALILYEGGLTLEFREIRAVRGVVTALVTVGAAVTWVLAFLAARFVLGLSWELAFLFGAILVVTGPTVIGPLLAHIRPRGTVGPILKWEGIVIDPIGAVLAVLVYEAIAVMARVGDVGHALQEVAIDLGVTVFAGGALGFIAARLLMLVIKRYWVPDYLQNPISLLLVVAAFAISNAIQHESGLVAVTLMGIVLANQRSADIKHIIEFKENLRVLLLSGLFIVLGARLSIESIRSIGFEEIAFVAIMVLLVRPASIFAATVKSKLSMPEKLFLSGLAPRGIVAAAVASVFALRLEQLEGTDLAQEAGRLVPLTFTVIIGTVAIYGLGSPLLAKRLKVSDQNPQGILFIGAQPWVRELALTLKKRGVPVLLADSNRQNVAEARLAGLPTYYGNVLADYALREIDLTGIGRIFAMTPNDEVNSLAAQRFARLFDRSAIYKLATAKAVRAAEDSGDSGFHARTLFADDATFSSLASRMAKGHVIKSTRISGEFSFADYRTLYGTSATPLFLVSEGGRITTVTPETAIAPEPGQTIISLVDPEALFIV